MAIMAIPAPKAALTMASLIGFGKIMLHAYPTSGPQDSSIGQISPRAFPDRRVRTKPSCSAPGPRRYPHPGPGPRATGAREASQSRLPRPTPQRGP